MELLEKRVCPQCGAHSNAKHCPKSEKCTWRVCIKCVKEPNKVLVFHGKKFFVTGRY